MTPSRNEQRRLASHARTCRGKQKFLSRNCAANWAFLLHAAHGWNVEPYLCTHCGDYHVGRGWRSS